MIIIEIISKFIGMNCKPLKQQNYDNDLIYMVDLWFQHVVEAFMLEFVPN